MTWAKLDDRANEHRKQLDAGPEACWLWACGLMYANRQDARDGFIPERVLGMLYPFKKPQALATKLVEVGLWHSAPGGYSIHQFAHWNRSRDQVETEREATRLRVAKHRNATGDAAGNATCNGVTPEASATVSNTNVPDHSSSTPTPTPSKNKAPRERDAELLPPVFLPEDWLPDADANAVLVAETQSSVEVIMRQFPGFRDWWTNGKGKGTRRKLSGWRASWLNWVRNSAKRGQLDLAPPAPLALVPAADAESRARRAAEVEARAAARRRA